jgi:CPA2 family monovalent cation:H+ antiporter-2
LLDHALRSLGTPEEKAKLLVQNLRVSGEGGAFERRPAEPSRGVPELRQHRDPEDGLRSNALS